MPQKNSLFIKFLPKRRNEFVIFLTHLNHLTGRSDFYIMNHHTLQKERRNEQHPSIVSKHKAYFAAGHTRPLESRLNILQKLKQAIKTQEADIAAALYQDLHKSEQEAYTTEIGIVLEEISFVMKRLRKWVKPKRVKTPLTHLGSKSMIIPEPYGTVLVIAP